ncbi:MAG: GNAT family N-acetyltransferase [Bacillota bacterium]
MKFRQYEDVGEFLQSAQSYLEQEEAVNNLLLGVCMQVQRGVSYGNAKPFFAVIEEEGELLLAAVMTPPKPLLLYAVKYNDEVFECLAKCIDKAGVSFDITVAEAGLAKSFVDFWSRTSGRKGRVNMNMRVYRLDMVNPVPMVEGKLRLANMSELELLTQWVYDFALESEAGEMTMEEARETTKTKIEMDSLYLWEVDGKPVSMAASTRKTNNGIVIALVKTPEEHKRKGYATACVAALSQKLLDDGNKFCTLFTDLANPTSNSIYMKIGYKPICDFDSYKFE